MSLNYVQRSGVCKLFRVILLLHYLSGWYLIWKFCVFDTVCTLLFRRYSPGETLQRCPAVKSVLWRFGSTSGPFHGDLRWPLISQCTTISAEWNTLPVRWWMTPNVGEKNTENGASSFTLKSLPSEQNALLQFSCFCMWTHGKIVTMTSSAWAAGVWPPSGVGERGQDHTRAESSCFGHDYWVNISTLDIIYLKRVFSLSTVAVCSDYIVRLRLGDQWQGNAKRHGCTKDKAPSDGLEIIR